MLRSFRLKIGLLSLCLSGLLLFGFASLTVQVLERVGVESIDRELAALADAQVRRIQPPGHWRIFDDSLRSMYGEAASKQFLVQAARPDGGVAYESANWPTGWPRESRLSQTGLGSHGITGGPSGRAAPPREGVGDPLRPSGSRGGFESRPPRLDVRGPVFATLKAEGKEWRVLTIANEDVVLRLAMSLAGLRDEIRRFEQALLVGIPLGLMLIVIGGWILGQMALRPVNLIARTAETVTAHRLDARIPDMQADAEFRRLIIVINGMLDRLEKSFQQATRFSADAAHELKTPLAILQAHIEQALQRAADGSPEQREYAEELDEVQRLKTILGKLLLMSQADSGRLPLGREPVNVADMIRAAADDVRMLAPDRAVTVTAPEALIVPADRHLLNQVVENLVSNAVKFGDRNGAIQLVLEEGNGLAIFRISNTGHPVAVENQGRLFERFFRGDKARTREIEGSGLGLSLAREIARAHGGELLLERSDTNGTTFALKLPMGDVIPG